MRSIPNSRPDAEGRDFIPVVSLKSGGMGSVELVLRSARSFSRPFVIKRPFLDRDENLPLMLDEARVAGSLNDPRLVAVLDVGVDERGPFLVMEYIEGASLAELLTYMSSNGRSMTASLACYIIEQVALGLHSAHSATDVSGRPLNLVHRDVSPDNILLGFGGVVKLADFGIAVAEGRSHRTDANLVRGKPGYVSPEHLRLQELDARSDIFSLGVVLYETLTVDRLFPSHRASEPEINLRRRQLEVSAHLEQLTRSMLSTEPDERPSTCFEVGEALGNEITSRAEMSLELDDFLNSAFGNRISGFQRELSRARERASARPEPRTPSSKSRNRSRRAIGWSLLLTVVAAIAVGVFWSITTNPPVWLDAAETRKAHTEPSTATDQTHNPAAEQDVDSVPTDPSSKAASLREDNDRLEAKPPGRRVPRSSRARKRTRKPKANDDTEPWQWRD